MASFFSKLVRGGAAAGGVLYADVAREQLRADIMSQRDSVLNDNRMSLEKGRQEFETGLHKERMAQKDLEFERSLETPRAKSDAIVLGSMERLEALKVAHAAATTDEERTSISNKMMAEQATPVETSKDGESTAAIREARILVTLEEFKTVADALKYLRSKEGNMTLELFRAMADKQDSLFLGPGDDGYQSTEEMLIEARRLAKPSDSTASGDREHFNTTKYPSVRTQADFDKLKSDDMYFDIFDGEEYRKP